MGHRFSGQPARQMSRCRGLVVCLSFVILSGVARGDGNLLSNPGFESGAGGQPEGWVTFVPGGGTPVFTWDDTKSHDGTCSVRIEAGTPGPGMWQQTVDVQPGTVYTLTGYVSFADIVAPGRCDLQVVFRSAGGTMLEMIDLPPHDGTRPFELDFPYRLKFRAPEGAVQAEVNCLLAGPGTAWFDDLDFRAAPVGEIAGSVTCEGEPVAGARVWIWGDPWGQVCQAYTDADGRYVLADVPVAFPRYVLYAGKAGYRTRPGGDVDIIPGEAVTVDFELVAGSDPPDDLRVKYGFLELGKAEEPLAVPADAVIPADPADYPAPVQPYLASDEYITADDPVVVALADQLLAGLDPADRDNTYAVSWAVYEWIARNINHDALFGGADTAYSDVTSGIWQTIQPPGWCWGRSFLDWGYKPADVLDVGCAICVEHSWLASAVLRALNIPARARCGSAQFWVQRPGEYGYWVGLSTSGGSNSYRQHGLLGPGFGNSPSPAYYSVTSEPMLQEDWDAANKGLWRESHPWGEVYPGTAGGLAQAEADLDDFAVTGQAPHGPGAPPSGDRYQIHYSDVTINLFNVGTQRTLDVRFPMVTESATHLDTGRREWWSSHPECVTGTWIEEITNPPVEGVQRWFHVEFDLTGLLSLGDHDGDGDVDLIDHAALAACLTGPGATIEQANCSVFDFDGDRDVDLRDFLVFQAACEGS